MENKIRKNNLRDVAEKENVSLGTASKVINGLYVRPEMRIRVEQAIRELHYVPNEVARSLKVRRSRTVGAVIPDIASPVYGQLLRGIESVGQDAGYSLIIYDTNMSGRTASRALELFKEKMVSGILYVSNTISLPLEQELRETGIPTVLIMTKASGKGFSTVGLDNEAAALELTRHLISRGHRRILHLAGEPDDENAGAPRYRGYRRALEENGIPVDPCLVRFGGYGPDRGYRDTRSAIEAGLSFSAVFAVADEVAIGAMKALREAGMKIPEDVSVAGFDGIAMADYTSPALCTVEQPFYQMGEEGTKILIDAMEKGKGEAHILLSARIRNPESIAKSR